MIAIQERDRDRRFCTQHGMPQGRAHTQDEEMLQRFDKATPLVRS